MTTKKIAFKLLLTFAVCCFVSTVALSQQNVFGFNAGRGDLISINMRYFANGIVNDSPDARPDRDIVIDAENTYEMHKLKMPKLNSYIYNDIRFEADKLFVASAGSEEQIINVQILENMKSGEKWGKAILSREYAEPVEVEFLCDLQFQIFKIKYTVFENENDDYYMDVNNKILEGRLAEVQEYEKTHTFGAYLVISTYSIK
jgi:hypothetical protein